MKLIGVMNGVAAYREIAEEYIPDTMPPVADIIQAVVARYQFAQFPMFPPGMAAPGNWSFGQGRFAKEDTVFAIAQLVMSPKGDSVATLNTDQSDLVLNDFIEFMGDHFAFRLRQSHKTKIYWSHVVVEFDAPIEEYLAKIGKIEALLRGYLGERPAAKIKSLTFGKKAALPTGGDPIDILALQDFLIERRVDIPFEQNRYFSSAPLRTSDHLAALQGIEEIMRSQN